MEPLGAACAALATAHAVALHACRILSTEVIGAGAYGAALLHVCACGGLAAMGLGYGPEMPGGGAAVAVASLAAIVQSYRLYVRGPVPARVDLTGKVAVVTGANTGIGRETALQLMEMGATVVFACRSEARARAAVAHCLKATGAPATRAVFLPLDLSSAASIETFVAKLRGLNLGVDILVNNAGLMTKDKHVTADGLELTLAANHYGHFMLTHSLLAALGPMRIVVVSSALNHQVPSAAAFKDVIAGKTPYSLFGYYSTSKLANVLFARGLARRLGTRGAVVSLHPGNVMTEVTRNMPAWMQWGHFLARPFLALILKRPPHGAYTSVYAASAPVKELGAAARGGYLVHCAPAPVNPLADDAALADWLWEHSEAELGLKAMEAVPSKE
mmetsp:Transcript_18051/g.55334  ORF Transcript_18051/g.55334 Transcript_18051/m.55334 type:complete len:388 (-) Transcript_18051:304-1467(-)